MPTKMIDDFHESLLEVMRAADTLGFSGRYAHLKPSIEDSFHLPIMAQIATGSFWRKASPRQQAQLIQVFSDVSVGTYANRFSGFSGQSFQIKVTREGPQKTMLVDTVLKNRLAGMSLSPMFAARSKGLGGLSTSYLVPVLAKWLCVGPNIAEF